MSIWIEKYILKFTLGYSVWCVPTLFFKKSLPLESEVSLVWLHSVACWSTWSIIFSACLVPLSAHACLCLQKKVFFFEKEYFAAWFSLKLYADFPWRFPDKIFPWGFLTQECDHYGSVEWFRDWEQLNNEQNITLDSSFVQVPVALRTQTDIVLPWVLPTLAFWSGAHLNRKAVLNWWVSSDCMLELSKAFLRLD